VVEFYLKLKRIITYLTYICWEIDNFVIKSDIFRRFVRIFLKNYRVTMTTAQDTSCSESTMVLSARRGHRIDAGPETKIRYYKDVPLDVFP
jgi:hypothetical protein